MLEQIPHVPFDQYTAVLDKHVIEIIAGVVYKLEEIEAKSVASLNLAINGLFDHQI